MKKATVLFSALAATFVFANCASKKPQYDDAMLEKYPGCYHANFKIYEKCIQKRIRDKNHRS